MKNNKVYPRIVAVLMIALCLLSGCGRIWDSINDRAGNGLEDERDNFILYTGGTTGEIASQILEEILYNIKSGEKDAIRNMYCRWRIDSFTRSELQSMLDEFTGDVKSYERLRLEHNFVTPDDEKSGGYSYSISALYRVVTTDDTYQFYFHAYRLSEETYTQGLYSLGILRESEVPADGTFPFVPSSDGSKVFLRADRYRHIDGRDDSMVQIATPADFQSDDYSPEMFLISEKVTYTGLPVYKPKEAFLLTGYLTQAINEKDADKIMALFSPAAIDNGALAQADIEALIAYIGTVEAFVGGQMYSRNYRIVSGNHGFTGDNQLVTARYLCKTDNGYVLLNLHFFDRYDDDEAGYLGLWSIEAEKRGSARYRQFKSRLPYRQAGISLRE